MEWNQGRLELPTGAALSASARGPLARLRFEGQAIELTRPRGTSIEADDTVALEVRHPIANASSVWVPHLSPEDENVIGDWVFRSPAILVAGDGCALAFVVDVDDVARAAGFRVWLDYDHRSRTVTLAAGAYRQDGHVFFVREPARFDHDVEVSLRLHVVESDRPEDIANPYGMAARWCWDRWGRRGAAETPETPFRSHLERIVHWAFSPGGWSESVWQHATLPGVVPETDVAAPVFIVDVGRHPSVPPAERTWRERRSLWNQAWFSTQRCANGLLRYARQVGSSDLEARARQMTELALAAPSTDGLFPAVLVAEDDGRWRWTNSDRRPPSVSEDAIHLVDAAFTCRKLLEWHQLTGDPRARTRARTFVERLLRLQRPSGALPGWVEPDGHVASELAEGPESAVSIALLFELGEHDAAQAGLAFLEGVASEGRWEDFETYYSCAPWGSTDQRGRRVPRNGVFKQNSLSIAWSAEAFLLGYRATHDDAWLRLARRCIDELSLYQAVWSPPFLPAPAHGGFGVMNADAEWNDARQSLFAPLYLDLGTALAPDAGGTELVERGMSALSASFRMLYCPENAGLARAYEARFPFFGPETYGFMMENQGHDVAQPIGPFTIYTWGNGSALAAVATVRDLFPELAREYGLA